jgi:hypothetical protein
MVLGTAHDCEDARYQFIFVEWLRHVVVGAKAETLDLVLDAGNAGQDQDRCFYLGEAQRSEYVKSRHIGQVQVEQDNVIVVQLAEIDALFAQIGSVGLEALGFEHQFG